MNTEKQAKEWFEKPHSIYIVIGIIALIMWAISDLLYCNFNEWEKAGSFGDAFGFLNTFFSGCAFAE